MKCRPECGACCIAPSISSPIPGMPQGKPAGVHCINLTSDYRCKIFDSPDRPAVCAGFHAAPDVCGDNQQQAISLIQALESLTGNCTGLPSTE